MQILFKTIVTAILIAIIATVSKRIPTLGAVIASLPITSILAMIWLYQDTKDIDKVADLSMSIFWVVIPSVVFFLVLNILLKRQWSFYLSLIFSSTIMAVTYYIYIYILRYFKVNI